jgi:hypothetical protein
MSTEGKMNINERRKYLRRMRPRYAKASRKERGQLLDDMEAMTEMHRKSLIRLMNGDLERKPRGKERGKIYGAEVDGVLRIHRRESGLHLCGAIEVCIISPVKQARSQVVRGLIATFTSSTVNWSPMRADGHIRVGAR